MSVLDTIKAANLHAPTRKTLTQLVLQARQEGEDGREQTPAENDPGCSCTERGHPPSVSHLLGRYLLRDPKFFHRYDGHYRIEEDDSGKTLIFGARYDATYQLMYGAAVRVLISDDTPHHVAIRLLLEIAQKIGRSPACSDCGCLLTEDESLAVKAQNDIPF